MNFIHVYKRAHQVKLQRLKKIKTLQCATVGTDIMGLKRVLCVAVDLATC